MSCNNWVHNICEGISDLDKELVPEFNCLKCRGVLDLESMKELAGCRMDDLNNKLCTINAEYDRVHAKCLNFEQIALDATGDLEKNLNSKLHQYRIHRQAYHGKVFVGNHCKKLLRYHEDVCSVLPEGNLFRVCLVELFATFQSLTPLLLSKRI